MMKVVRDTKEFRVLEMDKSSLELRVRQRFQDNILIQEGILVPLEFIRFAAVQATKKQSREAMKRNAQVSKGDKCDVSIPLPFTVYQGVIYVYTQNLCSLQNQQQIEQFMEQLTKDMSKSVEYDWVDIYNHLP